MYDMHTARISNVEIVMCVVIKNDGFCSSQTLFNDRDTEEAIESVHINRAVIKSRGPGIFPGYYECGPQQLSFENRRKIKPKEIPTCLIPHLLDVFTRQLEILVTTLVLTLKVPIVTNSNFLLTISIHYHEIRL